MTNPTDIHALVEQIIAALQKEQDRLDGEDYLMDTGDCIAVIREQFTAPTHATEITEAMGEREAVVKWLRKQDGDWPYPQRGHELADALERGDHRKGTDHEE